MGTIAIRLFGCGQALMKLRNGKIIIGIAHIVEIVSGPDLPPLEHGAFLHRALDARPGVSHETWVPREHSKDSSRL